MHQQIIDKWGQKFHFLHYISYDIGIIKMKNFWLLPGKVFWKVYDQTFVLGFSVLGLSNQGHVYVRCLAPRAPRLGVPPLAMERSKMPVFWHDKAPC